jgi:putative transcriptional regulator
MLSTTSAAAGHLLISEPFMMDPNFKRSVIIITEYSEAGVVGFVLNHLSEFMLGDVLPDVSYSEMPLYIGGPVGANTLHFIHNCPDKIPGGIEITEGIFWGGDFETVKDLIANYQLNDDEIRFFTGYSGWSADQLTEELQENTWIVTDKVGTDTIFTHNEETLWRDVIIGLGRRYAHIANFPENPALN